MAQGSRIEWTEATWNPITGCDPVSAGCRNCYARRMAGRLAGRYGYPADEPFGVTYHPDRLEEPLCWRKPRRVFVCSMGDLFHKDVQDEWICNVFNVIRECEARKLGHVFQILTKRPERMLDVAQRIRWDWTGEGRVWMGADKATPGLSLLGGKSGVSLLTSLWLGVTAENQDAVDERLPILTQIPAAVRFVSVEPMLSEVDLAQYLSQYDWRPTYDYYQEYMRMHGIDSDGKPILIEPGLDWVICGSETGPNARPMDEDWVRSLRDQCEDACVPFFYKQRLDGNGHKVSLPELDGCTWEEMPRVWCGADLEGGTQYQADTIRGKRG